MLKEIVVSASAAALAFPASECNRSVCGDGIVEGPEICELGEEARCVDLNSDAYVDGTAPCRADCLDYDVSDCVGVFGVIDLDDDPHRPAFLHLSDLDNDGSDELIVSAFDQSGPVGSGGHVRLYKMVRPGDPTEWNVSIVEGTEGVQFPNRISTPDIDRDGDLDLLLPSGFLACAPGVCGGMAWLEQTAEGFVKHTLVEGAQRFYHHGELADMNHDGYVDMVTVAEKKPFFADGSAEVQIFYGNNTAERFDPVPEVLAQGLGSIPTLIDLDGDSDLDIASAEYFGTTGSFAWLENPGDDGDWTRHVIDDESGKSIMLMFVPNLYGDGVLRAVGANHTNTQDDQNDAESTVFVFTPYADPTQPWHRVSISEGIVSRPSPALGKQGAPGVFDVGDIGGDGDIDVVVHGDGDGRVFLLEQVTSGGFETIVLDTDVPQGGVVVGDLDGDGADEIIASSYEANTLRLYRADGQGQHDPTEP